MGCHTAQHMSRRRAWSILLWTVLCLLDMSMSRLPKRSLLDPVCESFCNSGFQESIGNCNCGYIMFSKRSAPSIQYFDEDYDDDDDIIMRSGSDAIGDPDLAELTNEEIIDALDILEKIKNNQHHTKQLSDRELALFLWLVTSIETSNTK